MKGGSLYFLTFICKMGIMSLFLKMRRWWILKIMKVIVHHRYSCNANSHFCLQALYPGGLE